MNEEQKAWLEKVMGIITNAKAANTPEHYESAVGQIQDAIDSSPEP